MNIKYIQGSWTYCLHHKRHAVLANDAVVATCGPDYTDAAGKQDEAGAEGEANAKLISAAPDLLAACEKALWLLDATASGDVNEQLRAAIKKAKGEA
jgi:hypothetical protein